MSQGQPIKEFVNQLRSEIDDAISSAESGGQSTFLRLDKLTLSMQVVAEDAKVVGGKINLYAVTLGTDLKEKRSNSHTVTLEMKPLRAPITGRVAVDADMAH